MLRLCLLILVCLLSACTWVHIAPGASAVRVLTAAPEDCQKQGEVNVSVRHNIAFIERNPLKVRDELETLARNEAPALNANAIHPLSEPVDGHQRFALWACSH